MIPVLVPFKERSVTFFFLRGGYCDESDGVLFAVFVCPSVCLAVGFAAVIFFVCCSLLAGEVLNSLVSLQCCVEHWSLVCQHVGWCCVA